MRRNETHVGTTTTRVSLKPGQLRYLWPGSGEWLLLLLMWPPVQASGHERRSAAGRIKRAVEAAS